MIPDEKKDQDLAASDSRDKITQQQETENTVEKLPAGEAETPKRDDSNDYVVVSSGLGIDK